MDEKRMLSRSKRQKPPDEGCWDCSVCTYKNSQEAYKCEMCDVRKGTSTRKPRLNAQLVAQQVAQQYVPPPPKKEKSGGLLNQDEEGSDGEELDDCGLDEENNKTATINNINIKKEENLQQHKNVTKKTHDKRSPRLRNIDRNSAEEMEVTVGNVTVVITDYKPKKERRNETASRDIMFDNLDNCSSSSGLSNDPRDDMMVLGTK